MKERKKAAAIGRPRAFDPERALDRALRVFWEKGYEGASLSDLTEAMGINRPSLYGAFGNKETLFHKALDRYANGPAGYLREALQADTARATAERFLRGTIELLTDPRTPRGCLIVQSALACSKSAEPVRKELSARRAESEAVLRRRFRRAQKEGELPANADPADLASYITTVAHGMAVKGAGGATRSQLLRVMETALRAWPK